TDHCAVDRRRSQAVPTRCGSRVPPATPRADGRGLPLGAGAALTVVRLLAQVAMCCEPSVLIDHRFYRRRYNATKTPQTVRATLPHEMDLDTVHEQLLAVVRETL